MNFLRPVCFFVILVLGQADNSTKWIDLTEVMNSRLELLHDLIEALNMDPMLLPDITEESWAVDIYLTKGHLNGLSRVTKVKDFFLKLEDGQVQISASLYYDTLDAFYDYFVKMGVRKSGTLKVTIIDTTVDLNVTVNTFARKLDHISVNIAHIGDISFGDSMVVGVLKKLMPASPKSVVRAPAEQELNNHLSKLVTSINKGSLISYDSLMDVTKHDVDNANISEQHPAGPSNPSVSQDLSLVDSMTDTSIAQEISSKDEDQSSDSLSGNVRGGSSPNVVDEIENETIESNNEELEADRSNRCNPPARNNENRVDPQPGEVEEISKLRVWAVETQTPKCHVDSLLGILREQLLPELPACTKTFLNTNDAEYVIEEMIDADNLPGEYVYVGVKQGLEACVNPQLHDDNILDLDFNIDAVEIKKSSSIQLWPYSCRVYFRKMPRAYKPLLVFALWERKTKRYKQRSP
ncbi:hypothetical protein QAD02_016781 [Eretmocerus hayati]|uniref:Uncharacterized protein n=1 Tax=Eretmocerus hayati TaxID=131215 RepID=A0ACC2PBJ5_9HYME|nr:hypothetical protein QAD02_016781 [Eretmocerus hayati]